MNVKTTHKIINIHNFFSLQTLTSKGTAKNSHWKITIIYTSIHAWDIAWHVFVHLVIQYHGPLWYLAWILSQLSEGGTGEPLRSGNPKPNQLIPWIQHEMCFYMPLATILGTSSVYRKTLWYLTWILPHLHVRSEESWTNSQSETSLFYLTKNYSTHPYRKYRYCTLKNNLHNIKYVK